MKIIDRTLSSIDFSCNAPSAAMLSELCVLLSMVGADFIEVTPEILKQIGTLPGGIKFLMKLSGITEKGAYPGIERYIIKFKGEIDHLPAISEIQVNDIREIENLHNLSGIQNACISGLDDFMLYDYRFVFKRLKEMFGNNVWLSPQNEYGCATAIAVEWLLSGGRNICASFAGIGNYAALEELVMSAKIALRQKVGLDLTVLPRLKELFEWVSGGRIHPNKPVIGADIFAVESGVHVDAIEKNTNIYEPFPPESVGLKRNIVVGKHSGTTAISVKAGSLGYRLSSEQAAGLLPEVKQLACSLGRSLTDQEFIQILKDGCYAKAKSLHR